MSQQQTHSVRVTFTVSGMKDEFRVKGIQGEEGICKLFRFELDLAAESNAIGFADVVEQSGLITISGDNGTRYIHGMVDSFQQRERGPRFTQYRATLVPKVWRLWQRHDCRIFQEKTTAEIVSKVLEDAGISDFEIKQGGDEPPPWEYCVQYRETDWDFISRLLEEHGYFYFFKHTQDRHVLVIGNNYQFHPAVPGEVEVPFHAPSPNMPDHEHIFSYYFSERIRSGKVTISDYNPLKPSLDLRSFQKADKDADLEIYDYPGEYKEPSVGKKLAEIRLQEAQSLRRHGDGRSDCVRLISGYYFTLTGHERRDFNQQKYLITSLFHHCETHEDIESGALETRSRYENSFQCIPQKTPFRPPQATPKPTTQGVQTALVVGPAGQEIHTDKHGRVKVQFYWDRQGKLDDKSSCWIRVSQLWAGQGWGAMWIPRIGQEVIVDFIEGDPDRPIITGRVYHAQNVPPYPLPGKKTVSTIKSNSTPGGGGSNELRFEDKKGCEEIFVHAQKDQNEVVENDMTTLVGNDQALTVKKDRTKLVEGNETTTIKLMRTETVEKDEKVEIKGKQMTKVGTKMTIEAGSEILLKVGGSTIKMTAGGIDINGTMIKLNC